MTQGVLSCARSKRRLAKRLTSAIALGVLVCGATTAHAVIAAGSTVGVGSKVVVSNNGALPAYRWTNAAPMTTPRSEGPPATTLTDGRVLVAGGRDDSGGFLSTTELYDPAMDSWTQTGSMNWQ